ncbi:MAG TPA: hypothetical protein RMH99_15450 [Sandaracinaceae bacterium LLY-WYZ-13_1]|nr:hypothetical protein [Sandaracinaceae bacterium LLY-WYZ-13_1]
MREEPPTRRSSRATPPGEPSFPHAIDRGAGARDVSASSALRHRLQIGRGSIHARRGGLAWIAAPLLAASLLACGGSPPPAPSDPEPPSVGPLHTLVPPESTFVVLARPARLMEAAPTRRVITAIVDEARMDRFAAHTGVDPRTIEALVFAQHPEGRVVLARGPFDAPFAVREAGARMAPVESSIDEPLVRRAGFLGSRRVDIAAPSPHVLVWVDGTPQLAAAVLSACGREERARRNVFGADVVESLRAELSDAPFVLLSPQPLGIPRDTGVGMLLARERALAAAVRPTEEGELAIRAELRGEFPPTAHENFRALAASIAASDLGAALGAPEALPTLRIQTEEGRVALTARVEPGVIAGGLRTLLVAEMRELIEGPGARERSPAPDETRSDHARPDAGRPREGASGEEARGDEAREEARGNEASDDEARGDEAGEDEARGDEAGEEVRGDG